MTKKVLVCKGNAEIFEALVRKEGFMIRNNTWTSLTPEEQAEYIAHIIDRFKTFAIERAGHGSRPESQSGQDFLLDDFALFMQIEMDDKLSDSESQPDDKWSMSYKQACARIKVDPQVSMYRPGMEGMYLERDGMLLYQNLFGSISPAAMHLTYDDIAAHDWKLAIDTGDDES